VDKKRAKAVKKMDESDPNRGLRDFFQMSYRDRAKDGATLAKGCDCRKASGGTHTVGAPHYLA
jgi:hypothetical protein